MEIRSTCIVSYRFHCKIDGKMFKKWKARYSIEGWKPRLIISWEDQKSKQGHASGVMFTCHSTAFLGNLNQEKFDEIKTMINLMRVHQ